ERAAKIDDEVIIDFIGKKDGEPFKGGTAKDYPLRLGSNSFIPGFEEGLVGKKPGETFDLNLKFPKDYQVAELKAQMLCSRLRLSLYTKLNYLRSMTHLLVQLVHSKHSKN